MAAGAKLEARQQQAEQERFNRLVNELTTVEPLYNATATLGTEESGRCRDKSYTCRCKSPWLSMQVCYAFSYPKISSRSSAHARQWRIS